VQRLDADLNKFGLVPQMAAVEQLSTLVHFRHQQMQMGVAETQRPHDLRRQAQETKPRQAAFAKAQAGQAQRIEAVATKTVPMPTDDRHTFHPGI
jgi:hypothetical protein